MKKYFLMLLCVALLVVATGCGKKQLSCSKTETESGVTATATLIADLDDKDVITDATMVYDFGDKKTAESYCSMMKSLLTLDESNKASIECSGSKVTIKGFDDLEDEDEESEKMVGKTKDELIKKAEEEGYTCK